MDWVTSAEGKQIVIHQQRLRKSKRDRMKKMKPGWKATDNIIKAMCSEMQIQTSTKAVVGAKG